jgi:hypothetical protein
MAYEVSHRACPARHDRTVKVHVGTMFGPHLILATRANRRGTTSVKVAPVLTLSPHFANSRRA